MSDTCPSLICTPPDVFLEYSLQGFTPVPPIPPVFKNTAVIWCCPAGQLIAYTGPGLPAWVTLDAYANCLVGAAGTFSAPSTDAATALAQSALNAIAVAAIQDGTLACTEPPVPPEPPVTPCNDRFWQTRTETGSMAGGVPVRFSFVPEAGLRLSFYFTSNVFDGTLNVYAPDGVTLLATNINGEAFSQWPNPAYSEEVDYTFPDAQTYFIEVAPLPAEVPTGPFSVTIAQNYRPTPLALTDGQWRFIYVASTKRIFCLSAWGNSTGNPQPDSNVTVIDSTTGLIVATTLISAAGGGALTDVVELIFYNPNDDSVWVCHQRQTSIGDFYRLDPTTGAILETFTTNTFCITQGVFVPEVNRVYGTLNGTDDQLVIYNCTTRLFEAAITMPDTADNWVGWIYLSAADSPNGHPTAMFSFAAATDYLLFVNADDNSLTQTMLAQAIGVWDFRPLWIPSKQLLFGESDLGGVNYLSSVNISTGTITHLAPMDSYRLDSLAWDECLDCIVTLFGNGAFPDVMEWMNRYDFSGNLLDSQTVFWSGTHWRDTQAHPGVLYDPDNHRDVVMTNRNLAFV